MSDIDRYEGILKALHIPYNECPPKGNLRLPRDPKRALKDMEAAIANLNQPKGLNNERTRQKT